MKFKSLVVAALGLMTLSASAAVSHPVGSQVIADGFTYTVAGENLITNGDFSDGFNGWLDGAFAQIDPANFDILDGAPSGSKYISAKLHTGSGGNGSFRRTVELEPNKTYVVNFYHKGPGGGYTIVGLTDAPNTDIKNKLYDVPASSVWNTSSFVFTTTATQSVLSMKFAWLEKSFCATDFFISEVTPTTSLNGTQAMFFNQRYNVLSDNLLDNGDFANGLAGWEQGQHQGPLTADGWEIILNGGPRGNGKCIKVLGGGGSGSEFSFIKAAELTPNKTYALSFWSKVTSPGNSRVTLSGNTSTNDNNKILKVPQTDYWTQNIVTFRPTEAEPFVVINCAWLNPGDAFADFKLVEIEDPYMGKAFRIKQAQTGLNWACAKQGDVNQLLVADPDLEGYEYVFLIDQAGMNAARPTAFNLTCADGRTLHRRTDAEKWNVYYNDRDRNHISTMFNIRELAGNLYLYNHDANNILGTDGITSNSYIFNDKGYDKMVEGKYTAMIELEEVPYAFTNRWIKEEAAQAEQLYAERVQYPAVAEQCANLRNTLDQAYDVTNCTSVDDIRAKVEAVKTAATEFDNLTSGIADINFDTNAPAQYFDINGRPVAPEDLTSGVYILRQGNKATKVVR